MITMIRSWKIGIYVDLQGGKKEERGQEEGVEKKE